MDVHKLQVSIEGDASKLKQAAREATREVKQMTGAINNDLKQIKSPAEALANDKSTQQIRNMQTIIRKSFADMKSGLIPKAVTSGLKDYVKQVQMASGLRVYTDDYLEISKDMEKASSELDKLQAKMAEMKGSGVDQESAAFTRLQEKIERCRYETEGCNRELEELRASGEDTKLNIDTSGATGKIKAVVATVKEVVSNIPVIGKVARATGSIASKAFSGMVAVLKKVSPAIKKAGGVFGSLIQRFAQGIPLLGRFNSGAKQSGNAFGSSLKTLLKYGIGIRSLFVLFNRLRSAMVDGFKNLAQYSTTTNNSLSTLQSGLNQLKNSLATAFAPILDVIAPILNTLISYLVAATNAIGQFFAALTGKGSYTVAKRVATDFAAGANSAGDAAGNAADQAERLKRTLMGFDEINKLDDDSSSGSSGGSGGSGGSGAGDMFSTETVTNEFANWADLVKQAWADADFSEIGNILGEKLKSGLESIPWEKIQESAKKVGKSVATLINGFVETSGLGTTVGNTIGEELNTAIYLAQSFVENLHWESTGQFIADAINGAINSIDWAAIGKTISALLKGCFDMLKTGIEETDWWKLGESVKTAIIHIDWPGISQSFFEALGAALGGIAAFVGGLIAEGAVYAGAYFLDKVEECGGNVVAGIFKGIKDAIVGIATWIKENIFDPFITGFKNTFGIHSPSTVMAEIGGFLIDGLLNGLIDGIKGIGEWIKEHILQPIQKAFEGAGAVIQLGVELVKKGWSTVKGWISGLGNAAKAIISTAVSLVKSGWNTVTGWLNNLGSAAKGVINTGVSLIKRGWETVTGWLGGLGDAAKGAISTAVSLAKSGWTTVAGWLSSLGNAAKGAIKTLVSLGQDGWTTVSDWLAGLGSDIIKGTIEIGVSIIDGAKDWWQSVVDFWTGETEGKSLEAAVSIEEHPSTVHEKQYGGESNSFGAGGRTFSDTSGSYVLPVTLVGVGLQDQIPTDQKKVSGIAALMSEAQDRIAVAKKVVSNITANLTQPKDSIARSKKSVSGFTAAFAHVKDSITAAKKKISNVTAAVNSITNPHGKSVSAKVNVTGQVNTPTLSARLNVTTTGRGIHVTGGTITLATGGIYSGGQWRPITTAASGGAFSTGQMFIAREAGPELVGRIGSNTAVMNNNQIVSSVAAGVYQAVTAAMSQFASKGNSGSTPEIRVYVGGKEVTDVVIKDVNSRTRTTGVCPILT